MAGDDEELSELDELEYQREREEMRDGQRYQDGFSLNDLTKLGSETDIITSSARGILLMSTIECKDQTLSKSQQQAMRKAADEDVDDYIVSWVRKTALQQLQSKPDLAVQVSFNSVRCI